jgi:hypothetical protein
MKLVRPLLTWVLLGSAGFAPADSGITAAIYGGGPLYADPAALSELRDSGFTTVVAWTLHVGETGDLVFNDQALVADGRYRGDPLWPGRLAALKRGGSVRQLLFSVGSAGVEDFRRIQGLLQSQGSGPGSRLRRSFQALRAAIPAIDGFDLDDEDLQDPATTRSFAAMLGELGCTVTFCPYANLDFWVGCLRDLEAVSPGLVSAFHLQCYAGGAWNQPQDWIDRIDASLGGGGARGLVQPGLWGRHGGDCRDGDGPEAVAARFGAWKTPGIRGGFIWLYDELRNCGRPGSPDGTEARAYAQAIVASL